MELFSYCVITASDETQASRFRALLNRRIAHGLYPREIEFRVYADPPGGRVGSGGGTIWALKRLAEEESESALSFFSRQRVLVLHAGGESRRLPIYAPEGKIFAPVPVPSSSILPPVVLDLDLTLFLKYPWRDGEVVVASGDVILDFDTDTLAIPMQVDICGFAAPMSLSEGSRHGVYRFDSEQLLVLDFFQKQSEQFLREHARLEGTEQCALDIGVVSMRQSAVARLIAFAEDRGADGTKNLDRIERGELYLDLYLELLTACLPDITFEDYRNRMAGRSILSDDDLKSLYDAFHTLSLGGVLARSAEFLHFGSLADFPAAARRLTETRILPFYVDNGPELFPDVSHHAISCNSVLSDVAGGTIGVPAFVENCCAAKLQVAGSQLIAGLPTRNDTPYDISIPFGISLDFRSIQVDGERRTVAIVLSQGDSFSGTIDPGKLIFCGVPLSKWTAERRLGQSDVTPFGAELPDLKLFVADPDEDFLEGYWHVPTNGEAWRERFCSSAKWSIREINSLTDVIERDESRAARRADILRSQILQGAGWRSTAAPDFCSAMRPEDFPRLSELLEHTDDPLLRMYRAELFGAFAASEEWRSGAFHGRPRITFLGNYSKHGRLRRSVKIDQIVWARSPVRFDLGGGWSDTPPYTNRFGGAVTNVAVDLNGQPPIQVFVRPTNNLHIRIHSIDLGETETITTVGGLLDYRNPASPFALPKAVLSLLGLVEAGSTTNEASLDSVLRDAGSGIEITMLCAIPKGSGLGTSSVLAGVVLSALERFFGIISTRDELFLKVLEVEQMLTTGGGWQDQIGGIAGGVKYTESKPGLRAKPIIYQLDSFLFDDSSSAARMTLFYSGITRLAKDILTEVVSRVNQATPAYLFTHATLKKLAWDARQAISLRDLRALAAVIADSWRANIRIHASTTNDEVNELATATAPFTAGMKLLGAGGGGYAFFISDTPADAEELRNTLRTRFENDRARIVDFGLNKEGMVVTVS